ncbi:MAG: hypothetical protein IKJ55_05965 [Clostridia bacterium]|nr:hypothetical protein [Clostridia bacterium]
MYRRCRWWSCLIVGLAAGVLIYLMLPLRWLTMFLCVLLLYIGCLVMFH